MVRVRVGVSCRVRFNNIHLLRKSCTASYLALKHIWHDAGTKYDWFVGCRVRCSTGRWDVSAESSTDGSEDRHDFHDGTVANRQQRSANRHPDMCRYTIYQRLFALNIWCYAVPCDASHTVTHPVWMYQCVMLRRAVPRSIATQRTAFDVKEVCRACRNIN